MSSQVQRIFEGIQETIRRVLGGDARRDDRLYQLEQTVKGMRQYIGQLRTRESAQYAGEGLAVPEIVTVKITGPKTGEPGVYLGKRRWPKGGANRGEFENQDENEDDTDVELMTLPIGGNGEAGKWFAPLPTGMHIQAMWHGLNDEGTDLYHALWFPTTWLGKITACNKGVSSSTGFVKVVPCTGTINSATPVSGAAEIVCQIKKEQWGRVGDPCFVHYVGGGPPPWWVYVPKDGEDTYDFPTNLDPDQVTPSTSSKCATSISW